MGSKANSSSNALLLILALVITFPVWIALGGIAIGLLAGLFGAAVGISAAVFGAVVAAITLPFKLIFGWGHYNWGFHWWPPIHINGFTTIALIIIIGLIISRRKK